MESIGLAFLAALVFTYAVVSRRLARTPVSGPMVFVAAGLLMSERFFGWAPVGVETETIRFLLELTLALVLFTDATEVRLSELRRSVGIDGRLLLLGLPLCMVLGTFAAAVLLTDLSVWEAAAVGVLLAPTDAALGQAVVSNERVPQRIRQALNVESGLNDGLAVPVFALVLAAAEAEFTSRPSLVADIGVELVVAALVGGLLGALAGRVLVAASARGYVGPIWRAVAPAAVAVGCYAVADVFEASGFIAAFLGGIFFGRSTRIALPESGAFSDGAAHLLTMLSFFAFGAAMLGPRLGDLSIPLIVYALLSLTVVRLLPVLASLAGAGLALPTRLYIGWFGPRGLASIVFAATVVIDTNLPGSETIVSVMAVTVLASVVLHGATAWWGSNRYADWSRAMAAAAPEMAPVEHPVRRSRMVT